MHGRSRRRWHPEETAPGHRERLPWREPRIRRELNPDRARCCQTSTRCDPTARIPEVVVPGLRSKACIPDPSDRPRRSRGAGRWLLSWSSPYRCVRLPGANAPIRSGCYGVVCLAECPRVPCPSVLGPRASATPPSPNSIGPTCRQSAFGRAAPVSYPVSGGRRRYREAFPVSWHATLAQQVPGAPNDRRVPVPGRLLDVAIAAHAPQDERREHASPATHNTRRRCERSGPDGSGATGGMSSTRRNR